jgi:hypothetical protein
MVAPVLMAAPFTLTALIFHLVWVAGAMGKSLALFAASLVAFVLAQTADRRRFRRHRSALDAFGEHPGFIHDHHRPGRRVNRPDRSSDLVSRATLYGMRYELEDQRLGRSRLLGQPGWGYRRRRNGRDGFLTAHLCIKNSTGD